MGKMDLENIFKLNMTLSKLAAIRVAINFWELENVQRQIKEFCKYPAGGSDFGDRENWINLMEYVAKRADSSSTFPGKLKEDIKNYVYTIGEQIFNFLYHVKYTDFDINFGLKIYWAPYGWIDQLRMVREWLKYRTNEEEPLGDCFLSLASTYTDDDLIRLNIREMRRDLMWNISGSLRLRVSRLAGHGNFYRAYFYQSPSSFSAVDMFLHCFKEVGFLFAARYFWRELTIDQKRDHVMYAAEECLNMRVGYYYQQQKTELLIFFMKEMSGNQRLEFVSKNYVRLFEIFLKNWPYQELCVNILNNMELVNPSFDLQSCFDRVIHYLANRSVGNKHSPLVKYKNQNVYHVILEKLLEKIPSETVLLYLNKKIRIYYEFHLNLDYVTVSIIAKALPNDAFCKDVLLQELTAEKFCFRKYIFSGNYEELDKYIEYVLPGKEQKQLFKQNLNLVDELIGAGMIELATKNLKWMCSMYDTVNLFNLLDVLDPIECCNYLIDKNEFDEANVFLIWKFETEEERENVKKVIYESDERLRDRCYKVMCSSKPETCLFQEPAISKLLSFFLESKEAANNFRKNVLLNQESFIKSSGKNFYCCYKCEDCVDFMQKYSLPKRATIGV